MKMGVSLLRVYGPALLPLAAWIAAPSAYAQPQESEERAAEAREAVEQITVTATRRAVALDAVPVAVTALDAEALEAGGVRDTQGLQTLAPSLFVSVSTSEAGAGVLRMRGMGTAGVANPGLEPSVGVFVDGVYRPRSGAALGDLVDIQQVEVLRGPQGTLFGKNTSSGSVMVRTRAPDFDPHMSLWTSFGNRDFWQVGGTINGAVVDDLLALRLTAQTQQKDGFLTNVAGEDLNDRDRYLVRGQALLTPGQDVRIRLIADYARKDENCCGAPYSVFGPTAPVLAALGGTVFDLQPRERTVAINRPVRHKDEEVGVSAHLDWDLQGGMTLSGIVSHRTWEANAFGDADYSDVDIAYFDHNEIDSRFSSAEFTLAGEHGRFDWLVGAFYGKEKVDTTGALLFGADAGAFFSALAGGFISPVLYPEDGGQNLRRFHQDAEYWSLFTHHIVSLGWGFDAIAGLRFLRETKKGGGEVLADNSPSCTAPGLPNALRILCGTPEFSGRFSDDRVIGTVGLSKTLPNQALVYLSFSNGFKAGGITLDPGASSVNPTFEPEKVDAWELGVKYPGFGGRLITRLAGFWMEFSDFQINAFDGVGSTISNEAEVIAKGVELEMDWRIVDGLFFRGGVTFNDARFGNEVVNEALRGSRMTNAAKWSGLAGLHYTRHVPGLRGGLFGNVIMRAQSHVNTGADLAPEKRQSGYALLNARLGLRFDNNLEVALWGNNLTDRTYSMIIINSVAQAGSFNNFIGEPRTFGVSARYSFF